MTPQESAIERLRFRLNPNRDEHEVFMDENGVLTEDAIRRLRPGMHESLLPLLDSHEALRNSAKELAELFVRERLGNLTPETHG
jgi:hypothetical protein